MESLKNACEKMNDEKSENVRERLYTIKFWVKLKKMVTEMQENMLNSVYNESAM